MDNKNLDSNNDYYSKCNIIFTKLRLLTKMRSKPGDRYVKKIMSEYFECRDREEFYKEYFDK